MFSARFFSRFRAKLQKRVRSVAFQSILRERIRKLPKFLKTLKIIQNFIQYYSIVSLLEVTNEKMWATVIAGLLEEAKGAVKELEPGTGAQMDRLARMRVLRPLPTLALTAGGASKMIG